MVKLLEPQGVSCKMLGDYPHSFETYNWSHGFVQNIVIKSIV